MKVGKNYKSSRIQNILTVRLFKNMLNNYVHNQLITNTINFAF